MWIRRMRRAMMGRMRGSREFAMMDDGRWPWADGGAGWGFDHCRRVGAPRSGVGAGVDEWLGQWKRAVEEGSGKGQWKRAVEKGSGKGQWKRASHDSGGGRGGQDRSEAGCGDACGYGCCGQGAGLSGGGRAIRCAGFGAADAWVVTLPAAEQAEALAASIGGLSNTNPELAV